MRNLEYRNVLGRDWLWPKKDKKAWGYLTKEENLCLPEKISKFVDSHDTVVQAGGHCGLYSYQYSNIFKNVYTFEPETINFNCLTENIKNKSNIKRFNKGLGKENTKMSLQINNRNTGKHIIIEQEGNIEIVKLDDFNLDTLDLIHFDLEGYELPALIGAEKTIEKFKPLIVLETNDLCLNFNYTLNDMNQYLQDLGYKKLLEWTDDTVYIHTKKYI